MKKKKKFAKKGIKRNYVNKKKFTKMREKNGVKKGNKKKWSEKRVKRKFVRAKIGMKKLCEKEI